MLTAEKWGRYPLPSSSPWLPAVVGHCPLVQVPHGQGIDAGAVPLQPPFVHGVRDMEDLPTLDAECVRV